MLCFPLRKKRIPNPKHVLYYKLEWFRQRTILRCQVAHTQERKSCQTVCELSSSAY